MQPLPLETSPPVGPSLYDATWSALLLIGTVLFLCAAISLFRHDREYPRWYLLALLIVLLPVVGPAMFLWHRWRVRQQRH